MDFESAMREALALARDAAEAGEVPVGCVITDESGAVIGRGRNRREEARDACAHAEIEAIRSSCAARGGWNLSGCTLVVTLEPCPMCAGAIINARISTVVYGARDDAMGACAGVLNIFEERFGHTPAIYAGVLADECSELLREFFKKIR